MLLHGSARVTLRTPSPPLAFGMSAPRKPIERRRPTPARPPAARSDEPLASAQPGGVSCRRPGPGWKLDPWPPMLVESRLRRFLGWLLDIGAYVLFAVTFWVVGVVVDVSVYMAACSTSHTCLDPASDLPFDAISSIAAGCVGMLAASFLLRIVRPGYPAGVFIAVSACLTLLFTLPGFGEWRAAGRNPFELNNHVRFTLGPWAGCVVGALLLLRRAQVTSSLKRILSLAVASAPTGRCPARRRRGS
jgi:hypothetical protein